MAANLIVALTFLVCRWTEGFTVVRPSLVTRPRNTAAQYPCRRAHRTASVAASVDAASPTLSEENDEATIATTGENDARRSSSPESEEEEEEDARRFSWTQQWYPILPASYVLGQHKPLPVTVLGRDLVVWMSENGTVSVLEDSCPHRRAPLSTGKVVGDRLACRFHGWEFDSSGSCTKIPMDRTAATTATAGDQASSPPKFAGKFCVDSYPAELKGGLLWVFMDPTATSPPPISRQVVDEDGGGGNWEMYTSPVSFLSQIENSFDPSHAPFTHEGSPSFGAAGAVFSPDDAAPMERYDLLGERPLSKGGFELEHSPYTKSATPGAQPEIVTARQFVAPCTSVVTNPFFSARLHFVPSKPGETLVVAQFGGGGGGSGSGNTKRGRIVKRMTPRRIKTAATDFAHFLSMMSDFRYKFLTQDRLTMQGQDSRKVRDAKWDDLTPTPSDAGVGALQRWMRRYGGLGPFPRTQLSAHGGRDLSMWDSHGRYCPQCQATLKRLARIEKVANKGSYVSLAASLVGAVLSAVLLSIRRRVLASGLLVPTVALLVFSVAARALSQACSRLMARAFVTEATDPHLRTMEIYAA